MAALNNAPSDFSRKTFNTFLLRLLTQVFSIALGIIVARSFGPAGKGLYTYAVVVLAVITTLSGGMAASISRQYGRLKRPSGVVYSGMIKFFFMATLPLALGLGAFGYFSHQPSLIAAALAFPFAYFNQVSIAFSLAEGRVRFPNVQALITSAALTAITGILCFVLHLDVFVALAAWVGVTAAVSLYSLRNISKYARDFSTPQERSKVFGEQVKYGFRVTFNQLLAHLNFQIDVFIVLYLLGHASLGMYSIAVGIGTMIWQLSRPLAVTSYGAVTSGSPQQAARVTTLCVRHALINVAVASCVLAVAGPMLIRIVYGPTFAPSGLALQLLLPGIVAYCTVPFFSQYFSLQLGKPGINTLVIGTSTAICGIFTYFMAPHWGIIAGAVGTSISYMAALIIAASIFCRESGVRFIELVAFSRRDMDQYQNLVRWVFSGAGVRQ